MTRTTLTPDICAHEHDQPDCARQRFRTVARPALAGDRRWRRSGHDVSSARGGAAIAQARLCGPWSRALRAVARRLRGLRPARLFDANLMLEHVRSECFALGRRNVHDAEPGLVSAGDGRRLPASIASSPRPGTRRALFAGREQRRRLHRLHVGRSLRVRCRAARAKFLPPRRPQRTKNTEGVLALWRRHPQLAAPDRRAGSAHGSAGRTPAAEHRPSHRPPVDVPNCVVCRTSTGFILCPSQTEGFGHYLVEALSVGCDDADAGCGADERTGHARTRRAGAGRADLTHYLATTNFFDDAIDGSGRSSG